MNKDRLYETRQELFQFICNYTTKKQMMYMTVVAVLVSFPMTQLRSASLFYVSLSLCLLFCLWALYATKVHLDFLFHFQKTTRSLSEELKIADYAIEVPQFTRYVRSFFVFQGLVILGVTVLLIVGPDALVRI